MRLLAALRSALRPSLSPSSWRRRASSSSARVDERRVLALVDGALTDRSRARRGAAAGRRSCRSSDRRRAAGLAQPSDDERRVEAGQEPAGARSVRPAEERDDRWPRRPGRRAGPATWRSVKMASCHCSPPRAPPPTSSEDQEGPLRVVELADRGRQLVLDAHDRALTARTSRASPGPQPRARRRSRPRARSGRSPSPRSRAATTSTPGIWASRARCENAGRKAAASAATSAPGSSSE